MTDIEIRVLRVCRIWGPLTHADIVRRLIDVTPDQTLSVVARLEQRGLLCHWKRRGLDVSALGRAWFQDQSEPMQAFDADDAEELLLTSSA